MSTAAGRGSASLPPRWATTPRIIYNFYGAAQARGLDASHLAVFPMPNVADVTGHLLDQDVVWVFGGSVAGLLAMWRLHGIDDALRAAWQAGVVLTGVSAGSICWHVGGTTDSFGPDLRAVTNGLALVPYSNGVHYDSEEQRRPLFQSLIADGTLPAGYATDDGAGVLYRGTEFVEAVTEKDDAYGYLVEARRSRRRGRNPSWTPAASEGASVARDVGARPAWTATRSSCRCRSSAPAPGSSAPRWCRAARRRPP